VRVTPDPFEALALEGLRDLPPTTKLVWCALAAANSNVETTNEQLSARLALSSRSVRLAFEMLEARGLVAVLDRGGPRRKRVVRAVAPQGGVR
jgi:predicted ArsR family transcriptional regulator